MAAFSTAIIVTLFCASFAAPQQTDEIETTELVTQKPVTAVMPIQAGQQEQVQPESIIFPEAIAKTSKPRSIETTDKEKDTRLLVPEASFTVRVYKLISEPIIKAVNAPKVNEVLRNIGTCVVNGALELFSYYLPAPFMPLLATAAGLVIPFEPVVMLKQRMPVTSYRRAFQTAINTFLRTFDKFKVAEEFDPYMTRRFNRRFMNDNHDQKQDGRTLEHAEV